MEIWLWRIFFGIGWWNNRIIRIWLSTVDRLFYSCRLRRYRKFRVFPSWIRIGFRLVSYWCLEHLCWRESSLATGYLLLSLNKASFHWGPVRLKLFLVICNKLNIMTSRQSRFLSRASCSNLSSWYWSHLQCLPRSATMVFLQFHEIASSIWAPYRLNRLSASIIRSIWYRQSCSESEAGYGWA